jgi:hypothetical protein
MGLPRDTDTATARIQGRARRQARHPRYLQSLCLVVLVVAMNIEDEEALALWQRNRGETPMSKEAIERMESMLAEYYGRSTSNEFERQQSCVHEIFTAPQPMFLSDSPEQLSSAF